MQIKKGADLMNDEDRDHILFELQSIHPDIRLISTDLIVVADWVRLKCRYGCRAYGKHLCCPPFAPSPEVMRRVVSEYKTAILARFLAEPGPGTDPRHIHHYLWTPLIICMIPSTSWKPGHFSWVITKLWAFMPCPAPSARHVWLRRCKRVGRR